ncbi:MAG: dihydrofolate reductase [Sphingobacteriales bacterium]|jgi:dihydrofolate reductase
MAPRNSVFIATSLDGFIADKEGGIDWLHTSPNPDQNDMGYSAFLSNVDAIVMGRVTFETVLGFGIPWPYSIPVFVLSTTLKLIPNELEEKVFLVSGELPEVLKTIHKKGLYRLYIDGGSTIQGFLSEDLIDEMVITVIPILLGEGVPLFSKLKGPINFACKSSQRFLDCVVQNHFVRAKQ